MELSTANTIGKLPGASSVRVDFFKSDVNHVYAFIVPGAGSVRVTYLKVT